MALRRFTAVNVANAAPEVNDSVVNQEEKSLGYVAREGTLPDIGLVHGRLLVAAWEEGLEGVEDEAVELTMVAVEQQVQLEEKYKSTLKFSSRFQLRTIVTALLCSRNPWRARSGVRHGVGTPVPNPWLRNTQSRFRRAASVTATEATLLNEAGLAPSDPPVADRDTAEAVFQVPI